jgi:hypothetical protein
VTAALTAGLLGLFGTVVGAALTTWTTRQTAARSDHRTRLEARRQEYRSAVMQFAGALLFYREAERDRWLARHHEERDEVAASQEAYQARAAMLDAFYAVRLSSSDNEQLRQRADEAVEAAYRIREADTEQEMFSRTHHVRDAINAVIDAAREGEPGEPRDGETRTS